MSKALHAEQAGHCGEPTLHELDDAGHGVVALADLSTQVRKDLVDRRRLNTPTNIEVSSGCRERPGSTICFMSVAASSFLIGKSRRKAAYLKTYTTSGSSEHGENKGIQR
jgi:hypothetical protein